MFKTHLQTNITAMFNFPFDKVKKIPNLIKKELRQHFRGVKGFEMLTLFFLRPSLIIAGTEKILRISMHMISFPRVFYPHCFG